MINLIIAAVILLILGGVVFYIRKAGKEGAKCIGCPNAKNCGGDCGSCGHS